MIREKGKIIMKVSEFKELLNIGAVVSVIIKENKEDWYLIPIDYWVMNHWGQWGIKHDESDENKCELFLELIEKYRIGFERVIEAYEILDAKFLLIPRVYCDFDNCKLFTSYGEWALEDAVLDSWEGIRMPLNDLIVIDKQYWKELLK